MKIRKFIQRQIYRLQKVGTPVSLVLLVMNLSLSILSFMTWRGVNPYLTALIIAAGLGLVVTAFANFYIVVMRMHVAERRAIIDHDPVQVYAFLPFQAAIALNNQVPMMRAIARQTKDEDLADAADRLERWAKTGYIPKEEYPAELSEYYRRQGGKL